MSVHHTSFDVNASFPPDPKHRSLVEALVAHAAEYAGCAAAVAQDFADEVGAAFSAGTGDARPDNSVGVRLERTPENIEAVVSAGLTVRISRPIPVPR